MSFYSVYLDLGLRLADNLGMNKTQKYTINAVLLSFVVGSLAYMVLNDNPSPESPASEPRPLGTTLPVVEGVEPDWAVYFFYNDVYCERKSVV